MKNIESYRNMVKEIAARAGSAITDEVLTSSDDIYTFVDEILEEFNSQPLSRQDYKRIVSFSNNHEAFNCWDPQDVPEGTTAWWQMRSFYAMAQDIYDVIDFDNLRLKLDKENEE